jgi:hypothetical protein
MSPVARRARTDGQRRAARGFDAAVRGVLGQMQYLRAVREERGAADSEIEPALVEFGQGGDQLRRAAALRGGQIRDAGEERGISEVGERSSLCVHAPVYHRLFAGDDDSPGHAKHASIAFNCARLDFSRADATARPSTGTLKSLPRSAWAARETLSSTFSRPRRCERSARRLDLPSGFAELL